MSKLKPVVLKIGRQIVQYQEFNIISDMCQKVKILHSSL